MYLSIGRNILAHRIPEGINIYFDGQPEKCFSINKSAEMIFELCNGLNTEQDIINEVSKCYNGLESEEVEYILEFIRELINENIVEESNIKNGGIVTIYGNSYVESPTNLSLEITKKCPLRCVHCYTEASSNNFVSIGYNELSKVLDEAINLGVPSVQLTGGEVFEYSDIMGIILKYSSKFRSVSISTSGYTINKEILDELIVCKNLNWRISIDGNKDIHNKIRQKKDAYQKAIEAIKLLKQYNFNVTTVMTLNKLNINLIDNVLETIKACKVDNFEYGFTMKMGRATEKLILTTKEIEEINKKFARLSIQNNKDIKLVDRVNKLDEHGQNCGAGWQKLSIQANGDIYPCLSLPITLGNIRNTSIENVMKSSIATYFQTCISPDKENCGLCEKLRECRGCIAKAYSNEENCIFMDKFLEELNNNVS